MGPNPFFDDRMIVLDGSRRGQPKGVALPLLLDLVGKRALLHDDSVRGATFTEAATLLLNRHVARQPRIRITYRVRRIAPRSSNSCAACRR